MSLIIKFPTLITEPLQNGLDNQQAMIQNVEGIFQRYNNRDNRNLLVIPTRGKTREKIIKSIDTSQLQLGQDHCLLLKVKEFKKGYDDLYLEPYNSPIQNISSTDKIGSRYNYALLYPYITHDADGGNINRWVVFIYDAADKDDADLINTIKCVISKILDLKFLNVLNRNLNANRNFPWVSVLFTNVENINNEELQFHQYAVTAKTKAIKETIYQNVPLNVAEQLKVQAANETGFRKKIIKFFTSEDKKSYLKYEYEFDGQGTIASKLMEKYSYFVEVENIDEMYNLHFMEQKFIEVLRRFLSNE